jgi:hypothetical protein
LALALLSIEKQPSPEKLKSRLDERFRIFVNLPRILPPLRFTKNEIKKWIPPCSEVIG